MKLLSLFSNIILEGLGQRSFTVGPAIKGRLRIDVVADKHQHIDRSGEINPNFNQYSQQARKISMGDWKSGVPNSWILTSIRNNFDKVYDVLEESKSDDGKTPKILFVDEVEFQGDFYNIEYVVVGDQNDVGRWRVLIITSALQQYGRQFLKPQAGLPYKKLSESKEFGNIIVVNLCK